MLARWLALRGRRLRCSWSAHSGGLTAASKGILDILQGEDRVVHETVKHIDSTVIETNSEAQKARRNGLREILKENTQGF